MTSIAFEVQADLEKIAEFARVKNRIPHEKKSQSGITALKLKYFILAVHRIILKCFCHIIKKGVFFILSIVFFLKKLIINE